MPYALSDEVKLYYEEVGTGSPIVFVHEFGADHREWVSQVQYLSREYRCIRFSARGYLPSDVPETAEQYGYIRSADDVIAVMDATGVERAHVVGLSMGGYAALQVGIRYPDRVSSLVVAAAGSGSVREQQADFSKGARAQADRFVAEGSAAVAQEIGHSATRIQLKIKDPLGWQTFMSHLAEHSPAGSAHTLRNYQAARPSVFDFEAEFAACVAPTLLIVGDEDDACLEPNLFLNRTMANAQLLVVPGTGHAVNLEEPAVFNEAVYRFLSRVERGLQLRDPRTRSAR